MTEDNATALLDNLSALIEEERGVLLTGQLTALSEILERKELLIKDLANHKPDDRSALENLQNGMDRNQVLFDHALQGIRSVAHRLGALRRLRRTLDTYDNTGRKTEIAGPLGTRLERRA